MRLCVRDRCTCIFDVFACVCSALWHMFVSGVKSQKYIFASSRHNKRYEYVYMCVYMQICVYVCVYIEQGERRVKHCAFVLEVGGHLERVCVYMCVCACVRELLSE